MLRNFRFLFIVALSSCLALASVSAASFVTYSDSSSFNAALGGTVLNTQDFNSYSHMDNLNGVELLPGVTVTSNMSNIVAWQVSQPNPILFAYDSVIRNSTTDAYYDINLASAYNTVQFTIEAWDPAAPGPGTMEIFFSDATSSSLQLFQTGAHESDPVFFGVISDASIDRIRWTEGPEIYGGGNEETGLDNISVGNVNAIPEPATIFLLGGGLLGMFGLKKNSSSEA